MSRIMKRYSHLANLSKAAMKDEMFHREKSKAIYVISAWRRLTLELNLKEIMEAAFKSSDEFERFVSLDVAKRIPCLSRDIIEKADAVFGLPKRFVTSFEFEVAKALHTQDPAKFTKKDLDRLIIVDE